MRAARNAGVMEDECGLDSIGTVISGTDGISSTWLSTYTRIR